MAPKPTLAALQKQYDTERVRTRVLELWREKKYSIAQIATHKDVAKAKSTVQYMIARFRDSPTVERAPCTGRPSKMTPRYDVYLFGTFSCHFPHVSDTNGSCVG